MTAFELRASLRGHEDDVRAVSFLDPQTVVSASRDTTVRVWNIEEGASPKYQINSRAQSFVNAITSLGPGLQYPNGLVISGGKDAIIDVRQPQHRPSDGAEGYLIGHESNICALGVSQDSEHIISGSWDGSARLWKVGTWQCEAILEGHEASVWAVLAYDRDHIITGCADQRIRIFNYSGKLLKAFRGSPDVVRALCRMPPNDSSGASFASAGNDAIIRLWQLDGKQRAELHGHDSFIYSLANTPQGELVSSGEDRTVRIWQDLKCIQTITHPAISVWGVSVCPKTGDIASGASDGIIRVFTRAPERRAAASVLSEFEHSVKSSAVPRQTMADINKEQLPGPDFLERKSGVKDGQIQMIKESSGDITAHQWSASSSSWISVGTVVDSAGSTGKKVSYNGQDFDYVFDVDIEDGKPPLKLPFNVSQNPYEAATKFIQDHELPLTYLDQVANFIITNSKCNRLGPQGGSGTADAWGTESRYRPDAPTTQITAPSATSIAKILPQRDYLLNRTANLPMIFSKISEFNTELESSGSQILCLTSDDLQMLKQTEPLLSADHASNELGLFNGAIPILFRIISEWPTNMRLPVLDLARLFAASTPLVAQDPTKNLWAVLRQHGFEDADRPNNIMMAIRAIGNLFAFSQGRLILEHAFRDIMSFAASFNKSDNRNLLIALATMYLNFSILITSNPSGTPESSSATASMLLKEIVHIMSTSKDSEAVYRCLVGAGTLLTAGEETHLLAQTEYNLLNVAKNAAERCPEARIRRVVTEINDILKVYS